jgi:hypothetical protein
MRCGALKFVGAGTLHMPLWNRTKEEVMAGRDFSIKLI